MKQIVNLRINGLNYEIALEPRRTLAEALRYDLGMTGTKIGCGIGDCGACTVLIDGVPSFSCLVLAVEAEGHEIMTIEGVAEGGKLHPVQQSFVEIGAIQCGFCTPGMVLTALALLKDNPDPSDAQIRRAISGNLCRCTGYQKIVDAIKDAAKRMREKQGVL